MKLTLIYLLLLSQFHKKATVQYALKCVILLWQLRKHTC